MKKIKIILLSLLIILISGCSLTTINNKKQLQKQYITYDNTHHEIGNKNEAIEVLTYNEIINNKQNVKITFYIDKLPYEKKFTLCPDKQSFKRLKTITQTKNVPDTPTYETVKIDCDGYIKLNKTFDNKYLEGHYQLKILRGFNIQDFGGYDLALEEKSIYSVSHSFFDDFYSSDNLKEKKEHFWNRQK
jgi:hypothetical protein